jgi:hypothetical protein
MDRHLMVVESRAPGATLFACDEPGCGRRLAVGAGGLSVLSPGDPTATHLGSSGGFSLTLGVEQN